ncbi:MAG TPA: hypothetical protein ENG50_05190 [Candidatus Altiarchaeales archaeon]|nr:hypothetical protein [Candidatus Altiarchaeales archaeon]
MKNKTVCVVGLGYVGLPLAKAFSTHLKTVGFDIDDKKIETLNHDNNEDNIEFTSDPSKIRQADFVLIAVPTPVTKFKEPDLSFVKSAAKTVGKNLKRGAIVVLESTVYPGVTEEIVKPILEEASGLKCGEDFKIGYSPERINPGDDEHTLNKITKIVAGMDKLFSKLKPLLKKLLKELLSKNSAMDFKLFEVWMTKPRGMVIADARNVMPTSNANFLCRCMAITSEPSFIQSRRTTPLYHPLRTHKNL